MNKPEDSDENLDALKVLGLTEYEAKAYYTLLKFGTLTAEKISELGKIPLPRVYDTITELQKKGFVMVGQTRPKRFKPIPPDRAISMFLDYRRKQMVKESESIKSRAQEAIRSLKTIQSTAPQEEGFNVWSMERRGNLTKVTADRVRRAKEEVLFFAGDISWIKEMAAAIREAVRHGTRIRIIVHDPRGHPAILENIRLAKSIGCEVRIGYRGSLRALVIDQKDVYVITKVTSKGLNVVEGGEPGGPATKYGLMIIDNPTLIESFREYFSLLWRDAGKK
jgi:sugar-specific transcriptional regulator TrmB